MGQLNVWLAWIYSVETILISYLSRSLISKQLIYSDLLIENIMWQHQCLLISKIRGSLVVLKRSLSITILDTFGSEDGRISYIKTVIAGCKLAFISVYAPNQSDPIFFTTLSEILSEM